MSVDIGLLCFGAFAVLMIVCGIQLALSWWIPLNKAKLSMRLVCALLLELAGIVSFFGNDPGAIVIIGITGVLALMLSVTMHIVKNIDRISRRIDLEMDLLLPQKYLKGGEDDSEM